MVAHLARCQVDPAAPRSSIETLLHAFVPAPHVHHTHPDGINVLAGTRDGERLVRRVLRRRGGLDPLHPARLHARQAGRRRPCARTPTSSSSCSPSTAWSCGATPPRRPTAARSRSSTARSTFVNARTAGEQRFDGPARPPSAAARACCARCCRRCAARSRASGRRCWSWTRRRARVEFVSSRAAPELVDRSARPARTTSCTPSACRCGSRSTRRADDAAALARRGSRERAAAYRDEYRAYVDALRRRDDRAGRPGRARRADPARRPGRRRDDDRRPRGCRATSTTARSR